MTIFHTFHAKDFYLYVDKCSGNVMVMFRKHSMFFFTNVFGRTKDINICVICEHCWVL